MRTDWVCDDDFKVILRLLMPPNRLAVEVSLRYGLRINDVLALKRSDVAKGDFTIKEQKTSKRRRIRCTGSFQARLLAQAGRVFIFEHRLDWKRHRTRQAVFKDIKRASKALRLDENVGTHSARKNFAVHEFRVTGDLKKVQRLLNHSDEAVTMIYALADKFLRRANSEPMSGRAERRGSE